MSTLEDAFTLRLKLNGGTVPAWESEYRFHPKRKWRFDFAWPVKKVAVEIEGGTWSAGRHTRGTGFESDCEKYNEAAIAGWTVIRITARHIEDGRALNWLMRALNRDDNEFRELPF